jgi:hypothetical protein
MQHVDAVDGRALDMVQIVILRPLEALLVVPVAVIECVRVETNACRGSSP